MAPACPYCWGSHGCDLPPGHTGDHQCITNGDDPSVTYGEICSQRPRGHPDVFHWRTDATEETPTDEH